MQSRRSFLKSSALAAAIVSAFPLAVLGGEKTRGEQLTPPDEFILEPVELPEDDANWSYSSTGLRIRRETYYSSPQFLCAGGHSQKPDNESLTAFRGLGYFCEKYPCSWTREADMIEKCGKWFAVTRSWSGKFTIGWFSP